MSKTRLLIAMVLLFLPALAFADSTDPQMDPNDCSGSVSITMLQTGFLSLDTHTVGTFNALPPDFVNNGQPSDSSLCLANNTGGVIASVTVSEEYVSTLSYGCPSDISAYFSQCSVTIDKADSLVLFTFSGGTGIPEANGTEGVGEFGFTEPDAPTLEPFTILVTPEPSTLALISTFPAWAIWRWRSKK